MAGQHRILDFRNRPPLPPYAPIFELKRTFFASRLKRNVLELRFHWLTKNARPCRNRGAATMTPSMQMLGQPDARPQWWREIDAAGIEAVVSVGRLSDDGAASTRRRCRSLAAIPAPLLRLAPVNLEQDVASTVADCDAQCVNPGCVAINIEPGIRKRGGPSHVDNPDFYPIYETVAGLGVPVMVYTSPFAGPDPYLVNDMAPYERVLRQFPNLTLILGHGGYPRVQQVLDAAARHRNLYVADVYTFWPTGHLYRRAIERLQKKLVFGPLSIQLDGEPVQETLKLPLSSSAFDKYLWANGSRLREMRWLLTPLAVSTKNGGPAEKNRVSLTINDDRADEIMHDRNALYAAFMRRVSSGRHRLYVTALRLRHQHRRDPARVSPAVTQHRPARFAGRR